MLRLGPDRVLPASSLTTTWPDGVVEIRTNNHPSSRWKPKVTILYFNTHPFQQTVKKIKIKVIFARKFKN